MMLYFTNNLQHRDIIFSNNTPHYLFTARNECTDGDLRGCTGAIPTEDTCTLYNDPQWGPCGPFTSCQEMTEGFECNCLPGFIPSSTNPQACIGKFLPLPTLSFCTISRSISIQHPNRENPQMMHITASLIQ